jgi:hypothetical protein
MEIGRYGHAGIDLHLPRFDSLFFGDRSSQARWSGEPEPGSWFQEPDRGQLSAAKRSSRITSHGIKDTINLSMNSAGAWTGHMNGRKRQEAEERLIRIAFSQCTGSSWSTRCARNKNPPAARTGSHPLVPGHLRVAWQIVRVVVVAAASGIHHVERSKPKAGQAGLQPFATMPHLPLT